MTCARVSLADDLAVKEGGTKRRTRVEYRSRDCKHAAKEATQAKLSVLGFYTFSGVQTEKLLYN